MPKEHRCHTGLESVLITDKLGSRVCKKADALSESKAFLNLARVMAVAPAELLNELLRAGLELCNAGTAGLSLLETTPEGKEIFRWTNLAGSLERFVGGWTPRNFSPCGVCLDRNAPQLLAWPGRYFEYLKEAVDIPIVEALVIPIYMDGEAPGTIWIVSHTEAVTFDSEDARIMTGLAEFTVFALRLTRALEAEQQARTKAERETLARTIIEAALTQSRDTLEAKVDERTSQLQALSARLLAFQDYERRRLARELHDSTGQDLTALKLQLAAIGREAEKLSPELAERISENAELARDISNNLRTMSYLLHPPLLDELGLASALRWFLEGFEQRSGIKTQLKLDTKDERLAPELETTIFRLVQEGLTNIHRHSGSPTALIRLHQFHDHLALEIEDEGKGITQEELMQFTSGMAASVGLQGMRERVKQFGGNLEISSKARGLRIKALIPLSSAGSLQATPENRSAKDA
jgi:signal transduction histidine kinase